MPTWNKKEIADWIAKQYGWKKKRTYDFVGAHHEAIRTILMARPDNEVRLYRIGTLFPHLVESGRAYNIYEGEKMSYPARYTVHFRLSKSLDRDVKKELEPYVDEDQLVDDKTEEEKQKQHERLVEIHEKYVED